LPLSPDSLEVAVLGAVLYADIFDYPLTASELHHFLLDETASLAMVQTALDAPWLAERLVCQRGYWALRGREMIVPLRQARAAASEALWRVARRWGRVVGALPFVRMVAVTGALAVDNSDYSDDVDFLIVTEPGRVWLARAFAIGLVRLARLFSARLCPNYVLARSALSQTPHDLYIAHEVAQMRPLVGRGVYAEMRAANEWTRLYLPQAARPLRPVEELTPPFALRLAQRLAERLLSGRLGDAVEAWELRRKQRKFSRAARGPNSAAQLDAEHVKGHFTDHGQRVMKLFEERLAQHFQ
jgi:hypothetical protein